MIYAHKILPVFLSPLFIILLLMIIGGIKRSRTICFTLAFITYILSMPIIANSFFMYLEKGYVRMNVNQVPNADAIVVLSGMLTRSPSTDGEIAEWTDPDRFFAGIELYKSGKSKNLIFTRGKVPWGSSVQLEGEIPKEIAKSMGVPDEAIDLTDTVENTQDEAIAVKKLFTHSEPKIVLVTSAFHMPRAKLLFDRQGFEVIEFPVDFKASPINVLTPMDFLPYASSLAKSDQAIREILGRIFYRLKSYF